MLGRREQRAVHVGVAARLEHQRPPQVVVVLADELALLEDGRAFHRGKAGDDEPQWLPGGVGIDGFDCESCCAEESIQSARMPILLTEADVKAAAHDGRSHRRDGDRARRLLRQAGDAAAADGAHVGDATSFYGVMPAYIAGTPALGTKLVTVFDGNPARGLPTHLATIVLLDPETGALLALMDGRYITEARTAAVSAVSVQHLAREDASVARDHRYRRPGAQPSRSHRPGPHAHRTSASGAGRQPTPRPSSREMQAHVALPRFAAAESAEDAVQGADIVALDDRSEGTGRS